MPGKSILVFTDKADMRKSIMRALLSTATEVTLCFVRTTAELWHRLQDPKEYHHALFLDLSKSELQVEGLLRTIRQHERYGKLPIIVISAERNLPEIVSSSCSF